jgi:hypothetical protein
MATIQITVDDTIKTDERRKPNADLLEAISDTRDRRNLHGPYKTAEEEVAAMLRD